MAFSLSIKAGESFERAIAYIMAAAGFVIREQPHSVKVAGEIVGDLDILAFDPKSDAVIAVSCKEWKDQPPHTKDFNHMKELMDIEEIKHGVIAWTNVPAGVYPLIQFAEKRITGLLYSILIDMKNCITTCLQVRGIGLKISSDLV